jgi:branched-chain amino acid transport system permease protein
MKRVTTMGKPFKLLFGALLLGALIALPTVAGNDAIVNLGVLVLLYMCLASSWNILGGYTGQTNLGHAAFFGTGALTTRFLWLGGLNLVPSLLAGGAVAIALALLIGVPAFRLRGVYFAIGTLALAQILFITVGNALAEISSLPAEWLATYKLAPRYYVFLALALIISGVSYWLSRSKLGLGMTAVREEEDAAESLGVNALLHKLAALAISAFFAGLTGGAFAYYHVGFYPMMPFGPEWTFDSMMMTYIGGVGTIAGPIFGSIFFVLLKELLALRLAEYHLIVFGVLFILVVLFLPGGLVGAWQKVKKSFGVRVNGKAAPQPGTPVLPHQL